MSIKNCNKTYISPCTEHDIQLTFLSFSGKIYNFDIYLKIPPINMIIQSMTCDLQFFLETYVTKWTTNLTLHMLTSTSKLNIH